MTTPEQVHDQLAQGLQVRVTTSSLALGHHAVKNSWFKGFFDKLTWERFFSDEHFGNFVITDRATQTRSFEPMPLYVRVGMHLVFYGKEQTALLRWHSVEALLKQQSIKQGKIYDRADPKIVVPHIESFIKTYKIDTEELAIPDLHDYKTFNEFFARRLKPGARTIDTPSNPSVITSVADCRLTVFRDVDDAKKFWVKGREFSVASLLDHDQQLIELFGDKPTIAIFRLAPQDYHRFHSPADGVLGETKKVDGQYYTVNPTVVNENFDVETNRRDITVLQSNILPTKQTPIGIVAIGALLVGSVDWTNASGSEVKKGDDLGWFQYGGSTVILLFPQEAGVTWDSDLLSASEKSVETMVKVGEHIGLVSV
ncbi:hypothetical protein BS47DRAFT_1371809 [Hydnum rufescens UP504]|uniref:phosphatidylserine decarboxylase n=1 Tax=Hydnum rufescens UP504 TaxID=1448309 RepID=A0A9P6DZL7_9AGAM|nr:hypothetical protein BS47DRAFT_1371809 [Hydnum rufescens UP504]